VRLINLSDGDAVVGITRNPEASEEDIDDTDVTDVDLAAGDQGAGDQGAGSGVKAGAEERIESPGSEPADAEEPISGASANVGGRSNDTRSVQTDTVSGSADQPDSADPDQGDL
jgi:hypothetical protein